MDEIKRAIGKSAAALVQKGMRIGLGSGTTAGYFINSLGARCKEGLHIQAVATSVASESRAREVGIPLMNIDEVSTLDLAFDGADEIDNCKRMIKGAGGALVREKIIASMSQELIILVDESKLVHQLGGVPLPVEVIPFGATATKHHLEKLGYTSSLRTDAAKKPYVTDNKNWILDIHFSQMCSDPERDQERIRRVPGVVDTGFFFQLAGRILIGFSDGQIVTRE